MVREEESTRESQFLQSDRGRRLQLWGQPKQVRSLHARLETTLRSPRRSYARGQDKFLPGTNLSTEKFQSTSA